MACDQKIVLTCILLQVFISYCGSAEIQREDKLKGSTLSLKQNCETGKDYRVTIELSGSYSKSCTVNVNSSRCTECSAPDNIKCEPHKDGVNWTITSLNGTNQGIHTLTCVYYGSSTDKKVLVDVIAKPENIQLTSDTEEFIENRKSLFTCQAMSGNPISKIKWTYITSDNSRINVDFDATFSKDPEIFKTISSNYSAKMAPYKNGAKIVCEVKNDHGKLSENVTLNVKYSAKIKSFRPSRKIYKINEVLNISCVAEGNPPPSYSWIGPNNLSLSDQFLYIEKVSLKDSGIYECRVSNQLGSDTSQINLDIRSPPSCQHMNQSAKISPEQIGQDMMVMCVFESNPLSSIYWMVTPDGLGTETLKTSTSKYQIETYSVSSIKQVTKLTVNNTAYEDEGVYACRGVNDEGNCLKVVVLTRPNVPLKPTNLKVKQMKDLNEIELQWTPNSDEQLKQTFEINVEYEDLSEQYKSEQSFLRLKNLKPKTLYKFRVRGINVVGQGYLSASIQYETPGVPDQPTKPIVIAFKFTKDRNEIELSWSPGFDGGLKQIFLMNVSTERSNEEYNSTNSFLTLKNLELKTVYEITVRGVNPMGQGSLSQSLFYKTPGVPDQPTNLTFKFTKDRNEIELSWSPGFDGGLRQIFLVNVSTEESNVEYNSTNSFLILKISNLKPNTEHNFTVRGVNSMGYGHSSKPTRFITPSANSKNQAQSSLSEGAVIGISITIVIVIIAILVLLFLLYKRYKIQSSDCVAHSETNSTKVYYKNDQILENAVCFSPYLRQYGDDNMKESENIYDNINQLHNKNENIYS